ncbi:cysteine desulfurase family protein [Pararhodonellum marinum]|uniref:cysteine desulfurase family protein n=1 Tax=Pararhodonellum marinum TaxID=2755358 RepID=UPI0018909796|nr:cysteine desulfurase family protein [Pararhodonellum marinum]
MNYPLYFDHNATTPCDPKVLEAMVPWFTTHFGNASSSSHPYGWMAEEAVESARESVAHLIGAKAKEVIFTSGATEAINLALKGLLSQADPIKNEIITLQTEHRAVLDTCKALDQTGVKVTYLPVEKNGLLKLDQLEAAIGPQTLIVAIMYANNETGVIQPISSIARLAKEKGVFFLSDGVQAAGKIPVSVHDSGIDLMPLSAHKMYGPKGVGVLFVNQKTIGSKLHPQIVGGGQERGLRSGTLNVPGIVGFGQAAVLAAQSMSEESKRLKSLRDKFEIALLELPGVSRNGTDAHRLPHVTNLAFEGVQGTDFLKHLNAKIAVSSGSACSSISEKPSHVLKVMGLHDALALASVRFAMGRFTEDDHVDQALAHVKAVLKKLRDSGN